MSLVQLIYASRPFGYDNLCLDGILASARRNNTRDGITGSLVCREDLYLQLLEGPGDRVVETYARIQRDGRHTEVVTLVNAPIAERLFGDWAMRHDPVRSWMWTTAEVRSGAVMRASAEEVQSIFARVRHETA